MEPCGQNGLSGQPVTGHVILGTSPGAGIVTGTDVLRILLFIGSSNTGPVTHIPVQGLQVRVEPCGQSGRIGQPVTGHVIPGTNLGAGIVTETDVLRVLLFIESSDTGPVTRIPVRGLQVRVEPCGLNGLSGQPVTGHVIPGTSPGAGIVTGTDVLRILLFIESSDTGPVTCIPVRGLQVCVFASWS